MPASRKRVAWGLAGLLIQEPSIADLLDHNSLHEKSEIAGVPQQHPSWTDAWCPGTESEQPAHLDPALAHLLASARSDALRQEFLKADPSSYASEHVVRIYAATYNLNGALACV